MKVRFSWEEWRSQRAAVRALADRITPNPIRRQESSSDERLKKAFGGRRAPE
jgi:hypothetical protein